MPLSIYLSGVWQRLSLCESVSLILYPLLIWGKCKQMFHKTNCIPQSKYTRRTWSKDMNRIVGREWSLSFIFYFILFFIFYFSCCIPARQLKWNLDHKKREGKPILSFILYRVSEHLSVVPNFQTLESMQRLNYEIMLDAKNFSCGAKSRRDSCVSCAPLRIFRKLFDILLFSGV